MDEILAKACTWVVRGVGAAFDYASLRTGVGVLSGATHRDGGRKRR
ncbi:hypothetical protein [Streptomyces nitrosporeus]|nr:hypothetical protein [Streptomyces nitrosporeus]GGY85838.1 hypothetical protein GCM10010327_15790 [Streptomyces nitrosporeus]